MQVLIHEGRPSYLLEGPSEAEIARAAATSLVAHFRETGQLRKQNSRGQYRRLAGHANLIAAQMYDGATQGVLDPQDTRLFKSALEWHVSNSGRWPAGYTSMFEEMLDVIAAQSDPPATRGV